MNPQSNQAPQSDNLTTGQLSAMLAKGRNPSPSEANAELNAPPASEHAAGAAPEAEPDLSHPAPNSPDELAEVPGEEQVQPDPAAPVVEEVQPDPEAPPAEPGEETPGEEHEVTPKTVGEFRKRLESKNRKIADLSTENAELKERLEASAQREPDAPSAPPSGDGVANHPVVRAAQTDLAEAKSLLSWAKQNPAGGEFEGRSGAITISQEQAEGILENGIVGIAQLSARLENARNEAGHALRAERQARQNEGRERYPALFNQKSPEYQEAAKITASMPWLRNLPGVELIVGRYMRGLKAEQAAAKANPAAQRRAPAPVVTRAANTAPKPETGKDKLTADYQAAKVQYEKTGSTQDRSKLLALQREIQQAG